MSMESTSLRDGPMSPVKRFLRPVARTPVVRKFRRLFGRVGAPGLNPELEFVHRKLAELDRTNPRLDVIESAVGQLQREMVDVHRRLETFDRHMPAVLNAIASTNGTARILRRELDEVGGRFAGDIHRIDGVLERLTDDLARTWDGSAQLSGRIDVLANDVERLGGHIRDDLWPLKARAEGLEGLYETVAWLTRRVETVRAEMLHELHYGSRKTDAQPDVEPRVVNPAAIPDDGSLPRLNLGCGHIPLEGFVNVDMRELPGVDVVAPADNLPFEPGGVGEIFSAHMLEHFPQAALERQLLPYWHSLLAPGGTFRAVVPDIEAMIDQYRDGAITFENLRTVAYGGQEYAGDFHHTAFTPDSLAALLEKAGFVDVAVVERGRVNGDCLEFEVVAHRPA